MSEERPWSNNYPTTLNDDASMPDVEDYVVVIRASHLNSLKEAQIALETFMGVTANPAVGSCRKRLADLEATSGTDEKVKITTDDTTQGFLWDKLVVSTGLTKTKVNPAANEQLQLEVTGLQAVDFNEEQFVTDGLETPGATVTHDLTNTPIGSSNSLSGKGIDVYRNGRRMEYNATPTDYEHYNYNSGQNRIEVLAAGEADEYEVVYISGGGTTPAAFTDLSDAPNSYAGAGGYFVKVKATVDGLEFSSSGGVSNFVGLGDTPADYSGAGGYFVKVNPGADALEFSSSGGVSNFVGLGDTPANYTGHGSSTLRVTAGADAVEFIKNNLTAVVAPTVDDDADAGYSVGSLWLDTVLNDAWYCFDNTNDAAVWSKGTAFWELTDTPASAGSPNYVGYELNSVRVNAAGDGIEYQKHKLDATIAPTVNNDVDEGYTVGSRWLDVSNQKEYVCLDNTDGAAVWLEGGGGGGGAGTLDEAYNGGYAITVDGSPVTLNRTQTADDQESLEISQDFDDNLGAIIRIAGTNSGSGIPNLGNIRISDASIQKKIPETLYWFSCNGNSNGLYSKEGAGSWVPMSHGLSGSIVWREIRGTDTNDLWTCGFESSSSRLAHYNGSAWSLDTDFSAAAPANSRAYSIWAESPTEVYVLVTLNSGNNVYILRGNGAGTWDDLDSGHVYIGPPEPAQISKVGNNICAVCSQGIRYSDDNGTSWATDTTLSGLYDGASNQIGVYKDAPNNRFILSIIANFFDGYATVRYYYGLPTSWTELCRYTDVGGGLAGTLWSGLYVTPLGNVFHPVFSYGWSPNVRLLYGMETTTVSYATGTPTGTLYSRAHGPDENNIMFTEGNSGKIYYWNGATITESGDVGSGFITSVYGVSSAVGTATFGGHKVSFGGQDIPNEAIAFEVGGGATHALKAASGDVELTQGKVVLGEQASTPDTPSANTGVLYGMDVGGVTEVHWLADDDNEVQLTSGGKSLATAIKESGGTTLAIGTVGDGGFLKRDGTDVISAGVAEDLDSAYDGGGGSGSGRTITADSGAVQINADNNQALQLASSNGLAGTNEGLQEITMSQDDDNQQSIRVTHDFNSNQGPAIKITGSNSGDGTVSGETIGAIDASVAKNVPSSITWYAISNSGLKKKTDAGSWNTVTLPGSMNAGKCVGGANLSNVWVGGQQSGGAGYLAVDSGSGFEEVNGHATYGTHPMVSGSNRTIHSVLVVSASEVWTNTQDDSSGVWSRIHKWDPTNGWVLKYSQDRNVASLFRTFTKTGTRIVIASTAGLTYSLDGGETWGHETAQWSGGGNIDVGANVSNNRFRVARNTSGNVVLWEGVPTLGGGDIWTEIGTFNSASLQNEPYGRILYVDENGATFVLVSSDRMVYDWDGTPTSVACSSYARGMNGSSSSNVVFFDNSGGSGNYMRQWNGLSLGNLGNTGQSENQASWVYEAPSEGSLFNVFKGEFTGSAGSNRAVAFKVGSGATHALHADTGVVTLSNMSEDPATETGKVSYYGKEISGTAEAHVKDGDGNVVQLTSGGSVLVSGAVMVEEEFASAGTETPDDPLSFALTATPAGGASTPSTYRILVFRNGVKMGYDASPSDRNHYYYDSASNEIDVLASGDVEEFEVVMMV